MVVDAVRTYFDATSGLTELSRKEAVAAAKALLKANGRPAAPATEQEAMPARVGQSIQALAGELIATNEANRTAIADLVGSEIARQLERMDIVPRAEYERVVRRVAELERRLAARHMVDRVPVAEVALVSATGGAVAGGESVAGSGAAERAGAPSAELSEEAEDSAPGADTGSGTGPAGEGSGADAGTEPSAESGAQAPAATGAEGVGAKDAKGAATARGTTSRTQPRTATKSARTRSAPKRTTKAKGSTGKGSTKK